MTGSWRRGRARKVLLAHPSPDLYGSDRMLLASVIALCEAGYRVSVTLPAAGPLVAELVFAGARVHLVRAPVLRKAHLHPVGVLRLLLDAAMSLPGQVLLLARERPSLVYVNTLTLPTWIVVARAVGLRTVCHVHEAEEGLRLAVETALFLPLVLTNRVLVNSQATRNHIRRVLPRTDARVRLLYNGVAGPPVGPASPPREALAGCTRLVLVGRISPRKGTDVAVRAVAELLRRGRHVQLDLVGNVFPGYEWYEGEIRSTIVTEGLTASVHLRGFHSDVWAWLANADIVLVPSRAEPFGNVAVEAGLSQRPVIVTTVQGLPEVVIPGVTGLLVPPDNPEALADAVEQLMADWPRAVTLGMNGWREARTRFGEDRYAAELVAYADELCALTGRPLRPS